MAATRPIRALFANLIDYAGLFPPAGLAMAAAVRNYAGYLASGESWMLGRFVVPQTRLREFVEAAKPHMRGGDRWRLSVPGAPGDLADGTSYAVDAIETKPDRIEDVRPSPITTYFEIPAADPEPWIAAIAKAGARAKIRTGGLTQDAFPESARIAHFMQLCHEAKIAFKATAGLHHPVRGTHTFTYEPESACGAMHGFLNVFLAAALIHSGAGESTGEGILNESNADAFHFHDDVIRWHSHRLSSDQIASARQDFAISFGSCSFEEPVQDLKAMGLL